MIRFTVRVTIRVTVRGRGSEFRPSRGDPGPSSIRFISESSESYPSRRRDLGPSRIPACGFQRCVRCGGDGAAATPASLRRGLPSESPWRSQSGSGSGYWIRVTVRVTVRFIVRVTIRVTIRVTAGALLRCIPLQNLEFSMRRKHFHGCLGPENGSLRIENGSNRKRLSSNPQNGSLRCGSELTRANTRRAGSAL